MFSELAHMVMRFILLALLFLAGISNALAERVTLGVLAYNGIEQALDRWQPTADYLSSKIPGAEFEVLPLTLDAFEHGINKGEIDFVLTNPGHYVRLEVAYGVTRIATFKARYQNQILTRFSAAIFSRTDSNINALKELRGKTFAAVGKGAFGGFQLAQYALLNEGMDALETVNFVWMGFPHSDIVQAVLEGDADAGIVRSGVLEKMATEGRLNLADIRVLGARDTPDFPLAHSVDLYPEWPFAKLPQTDDTLAKKVAVALFQMPEESEPARLSGGAGWTIPLDYSSVHQVLRKLKLAPYLPTSLSMGELWDVYQGWIVAMGFLFLVTLLILLRLSNTNQQLKSTQLSLHRHQQQLEDTVTRRTDELQTLNHTLKDDVEYRIQSEQSLNDGCETLQALYGISNRQDLDREQRLQSIVDLARHFLGAESALLSHFKDRKFELCTASPGNKRIPIPLNSLYAKAAINDSQIRSREQMQDGSRYITCPVYVAGELHCLLEFSSSAVYQTESRSVPLDLSSELSLRILKLISQWIGNEVVLAGREREIEKKHLQNRQRFSEISPREKEVLNLLVAGESTKSMARILSISPKTIELHRANLLRKTVTKSSIELVKYAVLSGFGDLDDEQIKA